jgi:hypothetical protein
LVFFGFPTVHSGPGGVINDLAEMTLHADHPGLL